MKFSKLFLDDIRATADIVQIVGEVVELTPFPGNRWKGLCPFHNESGPSFSVNNNLYYCFGCQEGGDVFRFLQQTQNLSFSQAVRSLAERYNIDDRNNPPPPKKRIAIPFVAGFKPPVNYNPPSMPPSITFDHHAAQLWHDYRARIKPFQPIINHFDLSNGVVSPALIKDLSQDLENV